MPTIKPKADVSPKAEKAQHTETRWVRAFNALSSSNAISLAEVARQAQISERQAQSSIDVWNAAIHALDKRMALSVAPETLLHDAGARESGSQRVIRVLVTEGVDIDIAELAAKAGVSTATARRTSELYRSVVAAQSMTQDARNGNHASEHDKSKNAVPASSSGTSATSATKAKAA